MKRTEFSELKNLDLKVLLTKILQAKEELADLVLDKNMKKLKDISGVSKKKKDIAQMLTVVRQKELIDGLESNKTSLRGPMKSGRGNLDKRKKVGKKV